jgi:hypothetical protein
LQDYNISGPDTKGVSYRRYLRGSRDSHLDIVFILLILSYIQHPIPRGPWAKLLGREDDYTVLSCGKGEGTHRYCVLLHGTLEVPQNSADKLEVLSRAQALRDEYKIKLSSNFLSLRKKTKLNSMV